MDAVVAAKSAALAAIEHMRPGAASQVACAGEHVAVLAATLFADALAALNYRIALYPFGHNLCRHKPYRL